MIAWFRWLPFVFCCLLAFPALAETRVALVIGNAAYRHAPALANPKNDAEGMAASLKRLGFDVLAGTDLEKRAMDRLLQAFADKLEKADVALVFYAGHGLQVNGRNYLVPTDGKLDKESDLVFQAVSLDTIQGVMEQGQRTNIMILDACRDNPLARNLARSMGTRSTGIGRGLGAAQAGVGTLIVYATQPGNVALDGETGANSPFTAALLAHLETKGLEARQVLTRVRQAVIEKTRGKQVPWDSSSLTGDFFFAAAPGAAPAAPASPTPPAAAETPPPRGPTSDGEVVFWQSIKDSKSAADFRAYLEKYPNGIFAALARLRIGEIEKAAAVTPAPGKPDAPAPPASTRQKRTSTFEPNVELTGSLPSEHAKSVVSAQACASLCLGKPHCTAWHYNTAKWPSAESQRVCSFYRADPKTLGRHSLVGPGFEGRRGWRVSGVIRTTAAAAAPAPKPAATDLQSRVRELVAAAEGKRPLAADFCLRANWPKRSAWMTVGIAKVGVLTPYQNDGCGVVRVTRAFAAAGKDCRAFDTWRCGGGLGNTCTRDPVNKACKQAGKWEPYWGRE